MTAATPPDIVRRPRCDIHVGPGTGDDGTLRARGRSPRRGESFVAHLERTPQRITAHVTRVRTVKTLTAPNGLFEIGCTFQGLDEVERASLHRVLVPDNTVRIELDAGLPDTQLQTVMLGWITRVAETTAVAPNGQVHREVVISGMDAGKFLVRHQLPGYVLTHFLMGEGEEQRRAAEGLMLLGTVGDVLSDAFRCLFNGMVPAPDVAAAIGCLIDPALFWDGTSDGADGALASFGEFRAWERHGRFWNLFRAFADEPWNELRGDYIPDPMQFEGYAQVPNQRTTETTAQGGIIRDERRTGPGYYIVVRPQPFDQARWSALRTTTVFDSEIRLSQILRADDERVNVVSVHASGIGATGDQSTDNLAHMTVQMHRASANRHGTHWLQASTEYSDLAHAHRDPKAQADAAIGRGDLFDALTARARKLYDWYAINDRLHKGVWVIAGRPDVRIGERVANQETPSAFFVAMQGERRVYYVERVVQDYRDGAHYLTHLALTRGQPLGPGGFLRPPPPDPNPHQRGAAAEETSATKMPTSTTTTSTTSTTSTGTTTTTTPSSGGPGNAGGGASGGGSGGGGGGSGGGGGGF